MRTQRGGSSLRCSGRDLHGLFPANPIVAIWVLPGLLIVGTGACGDEKPIDPGKQACEVHIPLEGLPVQPVRPLVGRVTVRERLDRRIDPEGGSGSGSSDASMIQASFFDVSAQTSTPASFLEFPEADGTPGSCAGRVSKAIIGGTKRGLLLDELSVEGGAEGTIEVPTAGTGVYVYSSATSLLAGTATFRVRGSGSTAADFPSFEGRVDAVESMDLLDPPSDGTKMLGFGDFTVAWTKGDGDLVQIVIDPVDPPSAVESGGQVMCLVPDDGCYVLPFAATEFLLASGAATFEVSAERQRSVGVLPSAEAYVGLEVVSQMTVTVKNGVLAK